MFARFMEKAKTAGEPKFAIAKRGYDREEVHAYLEDIAAAFALGSPLNAVLIENRTFTVVKRGYDRVEVHKFLYELANRHEQPALPAAA